MAARATARLLARSDSGAPVVFVDQPLYKGGTAEEALEAEVLAMAQALGEALGEVLGEACGPRWLTRGEGSS